MEFSGLDFDGLAEKVFADKPDLLAVYHEAREANKREAPETLAQVEIVDRWTRIQEIRELWKTLFENWPKDRSPKEVGLELRALKAEEWKLLGEIQGERRTDLIPPLTWLTQFIFPNGFIGFCETCNKEREYQAEIAVKIMQRGLPRCKCNQKHIRLKRKQS